MIRTPISTATTLVLGALSLVLLLSGYEYLSHRQRQVNPQDKTVPSLRQMAAGLARTVRVDEMSDERWLVEDAKASGGRLFAALGLSVLSSLGLGLLMGCFTPVEAFCYPSLSFFAKVPATAALAVFFVMVGTGTNMYLAMIVFGTLPTLTLTVHLAVKEFPEELQYKAYTLGASHLEVIWTIMFRHVLPKLIDAVRLALGPAMVYLIAAEMLLGDVGLGYRIRLQARLNNMDVVYPYIVLLAAFGFLMDYGLRFVQRKLCPWYQGH